MIEVTRGRYKHQAEATSSYAIILRRVVANNHARTEQCGVPQESANPQRKVLPEKVGSACRQTRRGCRSMWNRRRKPLHNLKSSRQPKKSSNFCLIRIRIRFERCLAQDAPLNVRTYIIILRKFCGQTVQTPQKHGPSTH